MNQLKDYRLPAWTEYVIKLMYHYGTNIRYIRMGALGDIEKNSQYLTYTQSQILGDNI